MNSFVTMSSLVLLAMLGSSLAGLVPAAIPAPLIAAAPAAIGYAKAVPYNIPPYASRVDISTRNLAAPYIAAPALAPYVAAPVAAPYVAGPAPAPYIAAAAAPAPVLPYAAVPSARLLAAAPAGVIPPFYG